MPNDEHYRKLERMYLGAPINRFYRPEMHISEGRAEVVIQVRSDLFHAAGAVHGGVYLKLLDDSAFFAANSLAEDCFLLTASLNSYLTRPVREGVMRAIGQVVHRSGRLFIAESVVVDGEGREVARGSGLMTRSSIALTREIGYV